MGRCRVHTWCDGVRDDAFHRSFFRGMSRWKSVKARQLLAALLRIGWEVAWQKGSHRRLKRAGWPNYSFAFHDNEKTGLKAEDL